MKDKAKKKRKGPYEAFFKRFFDILFSLLLIVILSPILLTVAIIQKISLKGPILFCQYRPGRYGKVFKMYKFRSMKNTFDEKGDLLPDSQRITKFGKVLRKTGIDELPQLFNILKGDMSFVGPRPKLVKDMIFYDKEVVENYTARPGIAGLSVISEGRTTTHWDNVFKSNMEYAKKITLWGDIKILFKTALSLFKKDKQGILVGDLVQDYYYADYLLRTGKINQEQYDKGLLMAKNVIAENGTVTYMEELHNKEESKEEK